MNNIKERLALIAERIQDFSNNRKNVKLIAVSKTKPVELILEAFDAGQTIFGENRVQEAREKFKQLPESIDCHLIGPLQKNKAKYCPALFSAVHTLHRSDTALSLNKVCQDNDKVMEVLIQMNLTGEKSKSGVDSLDELKTLEDQILECSHLRLTGLMTMGDFSASEAETQKIFARLYEINQKEAQRLGLRKQMTELSMGMSGDYHLALQEGATYIRIGGAIFGAKY